MAKKYDINPDNEDFLDVLSKSGEGDIIEGTDGFTYSVESKHTRPTHFAWHQRIFPAGLILKKADSNVRIFVEAEKIGIKAEKVEKGEFDDKQKNQDGSVKPADRGLDRTKVRDEKEKKTR